MKLGQTRWAEPRGLSGEKASEASCGAVGKRGSVRLRVSGPPHLLSGAQHRREKEGMYDVRVATGAHEERGLTRCREPALQSPGRCLGSPGACPARRPSSLGDRPTLGKQENCFL